MVGELLCYFRIDRAAIHVNREIAIAAEFRGGSASSSDNQPSRRATQIAVLAEATSVSSRSASRR
jgi:hypothetical protein